MSQATARVIAEPRENTSKLWDPEQQVANRFREIKALCDLTQERMERGWFPQAGEAINAIRAAAMEGLELSDRAKKSPDFEREERAA